MSESGRSRSRAAGNGSQPGNGASGSGVAESIHEFEQLVNTIEAEIVPRLLLAHGPVEDGRPRAAMPDAVDVEELARLVVKHDAAVAIAYARALRDRGIPVETLLLKLLAPAARHLGELWERDACSFTDVTLGLMRLQEVLRALGPGFQTETTHREQGRHILLAPTPGEQHTFGLFMVSEFLRNAGWSVTDEPGGDEQDLTRLVRQQWFSVAGLSLSCEGRVDALRATIASLRLASANPDIGILVGGPLFLDSPHLVALVGADCTAVDGHDAVKQAEAIRAAQDSRAGEQDRGR